MAIISLIELAKLLCVNQLVSRAMRYLYNCRPTFCALIDRSLFKTSTCLPNASLFWLCSLVCVFCSLLSSFLFVDLFTPTSNIKLTRAIRFDSIRLDSTRFDLIASNIVDCSLQVANDRPNLHALKNACPLGHAQITSST